MEKSTMELSQLRWTPNTSHGATGPAVVNIFKETSQTTDDMTVSVPSSILQLMSSRLILIVLVGAIVERYEREDEA